MKKKIGIILKLILFFYIIGFSFTSMANELTDLSPNLAVENMTVSTQNSVKSGDIFKVNFKFLNTGNIVGENIKFILNEDSKNNIELLVNNNGNTISEIKMNATVDMELNFKVLDKAINGTYKIGVLAYLDESNPNLVNTYYFDIKIENISESSAETQIRQNSNDNTTSTGNILKDATDDNNKAGNDGGSFVADVGERNGTSTLSGGNTSTTTIIKGGKPKLIVDNYSVSPNPIKVGSKFDLVLSFYNTNKNKAVRNVKVVLNSNNGSSVIVEENSTNNSEDKTGNNLKSSTSSSVFMPVNSSNTFYIDNIYAGSRTTKTVSLTTPYDIPPNTYELAVHLEYEDDTYKEFGSVESLGINIFQEPKIKLGTINFPTAVVGQESSISADLYNTGRSSIYNLMIKMTGDFDTMSDTYYIGNFQPGVTENFSSSIIPKKAGKINGKLEITYEDTIGKSHSFIQDFTQEAVIGAPIDPNLKDTEGKRGEGSIFKNPILWVIIALLSLILIVIILKKRKKRIQVDELIIDSEVLELSDYKKIVDKGNINNEN